MKALKSSESKGKNDLSSVSHSIDDKPASPSPLTMEEWRQRVISNMNRLSHDEEYRKEIQKMQS